jgi:membrane fusion protein (multidrug efflux system)
MGPRRFAQCNIASYRKNEEVLESDSCKNKTLMETDMRAYTVTQVFRTKLVYVVGMFVLVLCVWAVPKIAYALTHETTDDAYVDMQPAVLSARVSGVVNDIPVKTGAFVKRGAIVARLDETDARIALEQAKAALDDARAAEAQATFEAEAASRQFAASSLRSAAVLDQSQTRVVSMESLAGSAREDMIAQAQAIRQARSALGAAAANADAAKTRYFISRSALARLRSLEAQGLISLAQLEAGEEEYAQAKAGLASSNAAVAQAAANLEAVRAKAASSRLQWEQERNAVRTQTYELAIDRSDASANAPEVLLAKRAAAQSARANVQIARVRLQAALRDLRDTTIRAPVDGYIAALPAALGQLVKVADSVAIIMPAQGLYVTANFKETQLRHVRLGAVADIHVDSLPRERFTGVVASLGAASQSALSIAPDSQISGNFVKIAQRVPIRIELETRDAARGLLRAGMSAEVSVTR